VIANKIRVALQQVYRANKHPVKILMHKAVRDGLRAELVGSALYKRHDQGDLFCGLPIVVSTDALEPLVAAVDKPNPKEWERSMICQGQFLKRT
jgi:hypothetical protein